MRARRQPSDATTPGERTSGCNTNNSVPSRDMGRFQQCRYKIMSIYALHWATVLVILARGMIQNGGNKKYVPVDPKGLAKLAFDETLCSKAYVDVHTLSIKDDIAFICCTEQGPITRETIPLEWEQYQSDICNPRVPYLDIPMQMIPFSRRLTRFPEAWILPMLPILIRLMYQLVSSIISLIRRAAKSSNPVKSPSIASGLSSSSSSTVLEKVVLATSTETAALKPGVQTPNHDQLRFTIQRIILYFIILNVRGWGLYIGANAIEDYVIVPWLTGGKVISPLRTDSVSDVEHNIQSSNHDCWYKDVLKAHHRNEMESEYYSDCYGRPFDFSDHIVLFLAHYLPIFVMEFLYCWMYPFWISTRHQNITTWFVSRACVTLHLALFIYMHVIVLHATYQTTAYFHTCAEIIVGFIVSLLLQFPLMHLFCSEKWSALRHFIGLPVGEIQKEVSSGKSI